MDGHGDDGERREARTAGTADEATALVHEAFGLTAWRPQPPPPPGWQRFTLIHCPVGECPQFEDARYEGVKARPPQGCSVEEIGGYFGLRCERPGRGCSTRSPGPAPRSGRSTGCS